MNLRSWCVALLLGGAFTSPLLAQDSYVPPRMVFDGDEYSGADVCVVGDLNGDGVSDLGALRGTVFGGVEWVSGSDGALLRFDDLLPNANRPQAIRTVDDVDGDGVLDVAIAYIGGGGMSIGLYSVGAAGWLWTTTDPSANAGPLQVVVVDDQSGDGVRDIVVGFPTTVQVLDSATAALLSLVVTGANGTPNRIVQGDDISGDGVGEFAIWQQSPSSQQLNSVVIYSGAPPHSQIRTLTPPSGVSSFGWECGFIGDRTGDGVRDLLIAGRGDAFTGSPAPFGVHDAVSGNVIQAGTFSGIIRQLEVLPDVTGDGVDDVAISGVSTTSPVGRGGIGIFSGSSLERVATFVGPESASFANVAKSYPSGGAGSVNAIVLSGRSSQPLPSPTGPSQPDGYAEIRYVVGGSTLGAGDLTAGFDRYASLPLNGELHCSGATPGSGCLLAVSQEWFTTPQSIANVDVHVDLDSLVFQDDGFVFDANGSLRFFLDLDFAPLLGQDFCLQFVELSNPLRISNAVILTFGSSS